MSDAAETLTQEAYDRLAEELEHRSTTLRQEITDRIEEARAHGDLKENAEYHSAKDEQGLNEDRIRLIEARLRNATITEVDASSGRVGVGVVVTVQEGRDKEDFFIGSMEDQPEGLEVVGVTSPMGKALMGAKKGDTVSYAGPTGTQFEVKITDVRAP
ncbi:MAG TPA: transcription elongation factor GreA [Euzebya sp.]|nr:transcription elongation factor GreA [Euzebya sp.]